MPTYEYKCNACEHSFEKFQSITAPAVRKCPECGKLKVRRLIGNGSGIIFRGSGFYQTDYRNSAYKTDAKADKPAVAAGETKSDSAKTKTEKPATSDSKAAGKAAG